MRSVSLLLPALALLACGGPPAEPPPAEPAAPEAAPGAEPAPQPAEPLYEVTVRVDGATGTGLRVLPDGTIEQGAGRPDALHWTAVRALTPLDVAELRAVLDSGEVTDVPDHLTSPSGEGATARWTIRTRAGTRTITTDDFLKVRVPVFDRIDGILRAGRRLSDVRTVWTVTTETGPVEHVVPCDPMRVGALQGVVTKLHDPRLTRSPAPAELPDPLLVVDFGAGTRAWRTALYPAGLVVRTDERGTSTASTLGTADIGPLQDQLARVAWHTIRCPE